MRVVFFSTIFPRPQSPNSGIYCHHLCKAMVENGHDVSVVAPRAWTEKRVRQTPATEPSIFEVKTPKYFYPPGMLRWAYDDFMWMSVGGCLQRTIAEFNADCVLSYWAHPDGAVAVRAAHKAGIPGAIIVGGSDALVLPNVDPARGRRIRRALQSADAVLSVSQQLHQRVVELGVSPDRSHVVLQGVEKELFSPGDAMEARRRLNVTHAGPMLVFVGNLLPVKGLDVMLDACEILAKRKPDFHLYLLGSGSSRQELQEHSKRLGLQNHVTFVGSVAQRALPDWYRAADLTVLSSRSEGLPNVLRESIACGTPFVSTDVGGIREIAQSGLSRLTPPGSAEDLATAIFEELAIPRSRRPKAENLLTWRESAAVVAGVLESTRRSVGREVRGIVGKSMAL